MPKDSADGARILGVHRFERSPPPFSPLRVVTFHLGLFGRQMWIGGSLCITQSGESAL